MNLPASQLAEVQEQAHRAKALRHLCADCQDLTEAGDQAGPCARHSMRCVGCGSDAIEERDEHQYADGIPAYWCRACLDYEP